MRILRTCEGREPKAARPRRRRAASPSFYVPGLAALGFAGLLAISAPGAHAAEDLTLGYQMTWGNLTLADGEISYRQSDSRYHLVSRGRTQGILEFFFPWTGRAETKGLLRADGRRPLLHQHQGTHEDETRWTRVDWPGADGAGVAGGETAGTAMPRTEARPPPDPEQVTPVPPATTLGTRDPFTVLLSLLDRLAETGRCEGEARIWDGRRRYDLAVTHLGETVLTADRPWAYDGPAVGCALDFERIGGFWREAPDWRDPDENAAVRREVWAAEMAPGQWVLVRAEMETTYGTVVGRLLPESLREGDTPIEKAAFAE